MTEARASSRKCEFPGCTEVATTEHDMPMSSGNPYPESVWTCSNTDHLQWAEGYAASEEREAFEQEAELVRCGTCGGDAQNGYPCVYGTIYRDGNCPSITGRF
jgi:hypothetical protein